VGATAPPVVGAGAVDGAPPAGGAEAVLEGAGAAANDALRSASRKAKAPTSPKDDWVMNLRRVLTC
jgi:hypothetical protein